MKHDLIFIILIVLVFTSCKTRKNSQQFSAVKSEIGNIATSFDKSIETEEAGSNISISTTEAMWKFTHRIEFDSLGNIRAIQETRRGSGRTQLAVRNDTSRNISIKDVLNKTISAQNLETAELSKSDFKSDSRLIQGADWVWVILSVTLVIAVLVYIFRYKKLK